MELNESVKLEGDDGLRGLDQEHAESILKLSKERSRRSARRAGANGSGVGAWRFSAGAERAGGERQERRFVKQDEVMGIDRDAGCMLSPCLA